MVADDVLDRYLLLQQLFVGSGPSFVPPRQVLQQEQHHQNRQRESDAGQCTAGTPTSSMISGGQSSRGYMCCISGMVVPYEDALPLHFECLRQFVIQLEHSLLVLFIAVRCVAHSHIEPNTQRMGIVRENNIRGLIKHMLISNQNFRDRISDDILWITPTTNQSLNIQGILPYDVLP